MRTIIILAFGLFFIGSVQAQVGSSISADGSAPNNNAMLDVQSPASGDGKGILIPRVTLAQRTTASSTEAGGLLDNSGNLRGGPAQGLMVYQTDGVQGLYFNTSQTAVPSWVLLGEGDYMTNYLPRTGGTMSGPLNMGAQIVTNVAHIDFNGAGVSVGRGANGASDGAAMGNLANGYYYGAALGWQANGYWYGVALGRGASGTNFGVAVGLLATGSTYGVAVGYLANGYYYGTAAGRGANGYLQGAALGRQANGYDSGAAVGYLADGGSSGAALGREANGYDSGAAVGYLANGSFRGAAMGNLAIGYDSGAAMGRSADGSEYGAAVGYAANGAVTGAAVGVSANGSDFGAAMGNLANGYYYGAAMGREANGYFYGAAVGAVAQGTNYGAAVGNNADGSDFGAAMGYNANGARTNVAIGLRANAGNGTNQIAIGNNVTNNLPNTARIRGSLYLDGGSSIYTNAGVFGSSSWGIKAFTIPHPLDPENKILRHFCLEGPQVWNVYAGNAQLINGQAVVQLPDYYSALNLVGSEIYSLTPISQDVNANAVVKQKVSGNSFVIAGNENMEVSWTIKVLRNDPGCLEDLRRRPVEQMKSELETGN